MVKVRILKRGSKAYLELPAGMISTEELELFVLKEGYYLLSVPLGEHKKEKRISEEERAVLQKLLSIRFEKRTPDYVSKVLPESDKRILKELERRGFVNVFTGRKYRNGVYNIRDNVYPLLKQRAKEKPKEKPKEQPTTLGHLKNQGFMIVGNKNQAFQLSQQLNKEMKTGEVLGVKGFDGRFYIVTRDYLAKAQSDISSVLTEAMDASSIASASKLDEEGCMAVLRLLAERGEVIEKKKGVFAPV